MKTLFFGLLFLTSSAWAQLSLNITIPDVTAWPVASLSCPGSENGGTLLKENSFKFEYATLGWVGETDVNILYISINLHSNYVLGGQYNRVLVGKELSDVFMTRISDHVTSFSECGIRAGDLHFVDETKPAYAVGTVTVGGIDMNGNTVESSVPVSVQYNGKPTK